jgi:hypothetical protein
VYTILAQKTPSYTLSIHPLLCHWYQPHKQGLLSVIMFSVFEKNKRLFGLFKIAIHGVSLWHFHVYMYYNPNWFISVFLLSTLVPFFVVILTGLNILYSFLYRKYIFIFLTSFFYHPSLHMWPPLGVSHFS